MLSLAKRVLDLDSNDGSMPNSVREVSLLPLCFLLALTGALQD